MGEKTKGGLEVLFSYVCWGMLTVFWNLLAEVNSVYILMQRIIWSMVFMAIIILAMGKKDEIVQVFKNGKQLGLCIICGVLVSVNWGVYIYAVNSGHVLDASLGYFVEPLLVAVIGVVCFRERPNKYEKGTYILSTGGLVYLIVATRTFPTMALLIAGSFAIYGAVKKELDISPMTSLFMETLCMTPIALVYVVYAELNGIGSTGYLYGFQFLLLPACGLITSVPLLAYNAGVKKISYYISGILMYTNPTLQFVMGLFYFSEPLDMRRFIAFIIIWIGIGVAIFGNIKNLKGTREAY